MLQEIERPPLLVDILVREILESIVGGQLNPKDRITEVNLSAQFNVSRTPLREALFRLESLGFIKKSANSRWEVVSLQVQDIVEKYEIVNMLENNAILRSTEEARTLIFPKLDSLIKAMKEHLPDKNYQLYREVDGKFHRCLFELHKNDYAKTIYDQMVLYFKWIRTWAISPYMDIRLSFEDHQAIVLNLKEHKINETIRVLDRHHYRIREGVKREMNLKSSSFKNR